MDHNKKELENVNSAKREMSGLMKVINAHHNKKKEELEKIQTIEYISFCKNGGNIYNEHLKNIFSKKKFLNIGKYIFLLYCKQYEKVNINISDIYNDKKLDMLIKNCKKEINLYNHLLDEEYCNDFFGKIVLIDNSTGALSYDELHEEIMKLISTEFELEKSEMKEQKQHFIHCKISNYLIKLMFDMKNRIININDFKNDIKKILGEKFNISIMINEIFTLLDNKQYENEVDKYVKIIGKCVKEKNDIENYFKQIDRFVKKTGKKYTVNEVLNILWSFVKEDNYNHEYIWKLIHIRNVANDKNGHYKFSVNTAIDILYNREVEQIMKKNNIVQQNENIDIINKKKKIIKKKVE